MTTGTSIRLARALTVAAAIGACGDKPPAPANAPGAPRLAAAAPVPAAAPAGTWVAVRRGDVRETVAAIGSFAARRTSRVGPQVSGRVEAVLVDVGDAVKTGQELARLDRTLFGIEVDQAKAAVATAAARTGSQEQAVQTADAEVREAEARLAEAEADRERMRSLWEKPAGGTPSIPKSRYDDATFRRDQAKAALDAARSRTAETRARFAEAGVAAREAAEAQRHAEQRLDETVVRAPFDGVVTSRFVDPGEPVTSAPVTHLVEIQETATLELVFSLPQTYLASVHAGTRVDFDVEGVEGGPAAAAVETVFPSVDEATRSFRCRALVRNPAARYRPGLLAQVRVTVREAAGVLLVPAAALSGTAAARQVAVEAAGRTERRPVEVGIVGDDAEIRSGLAEGERVLVPTDRGRDRPSR